MKINSISLKNFRNYSQSKIELSPRINLFLGNNGHGKTSLLEAVWICVNGRSYRTAKARASDKTGSGLGLAIVKNLAHSLNGDVGVKNSDSGGCNFWFTVPKAK